MAATVEDLRRLVGTTATDLDILGTCLGEAEELVARYLDTHGSTDDAPPEEIRERAVLEVAADLWNRRNAPNGILNQQYDDASGSIPIRISRDPLSPARPMLAPWVVPTGFA